MISDLGEAHPDLEGILMIEGVGLSSNVYVIVGRKIALIDAGSGPPLNPLLQPLLERGIDVHNIGTVIVTHGHSDHTGGLVELATINGLEVRIHPSGVDLIPPDIKAQPLMDGEALQAGHLTLKTVYTPGHSSESICLYNPARQILFSGDTVFPGGNFGRTDLPTGDDRKLLLSLRRLSGLSVKHLLAGHERPVFGEGLTHVKASLRSAESLLSDHL